MDGRTVPPPLRPLLSVGAVSLPPVPLSGASHVAKPNTRGEEVSSAHLGAGAAPRCIDPGGRGELGVLMCLGCAALARLAVHQWPEDTQHLTTSVPVLMRLLPPGMPSLCLLPICILNIFQDPIQALTSTISAHSDFYLSENLQNLAPLEFMHCLL